MICCVLGCESPAHCKVAFGPVFGHSMLCWFHAGQIGTITHWEYETHGGNAPNHRDFCKIELDKLVGWQAIFTFDEKTDLTLIPPKEI